MISGWFVVLWVVLGWLFLCIYMLWGRDMYGHPLWFWAGLPAPFVILLAIGYFYYGLPLFDWTNEPAIPVRVIDGEN